MAGLTHRHLWLCVLLGLALALVVLWALGASAWTLLLAALLLVCPLILIWGLFSLNRTQSHPRNES
jgi:hypothetical protein